MSLERRVAVVTGGGKGIGRACSLQLAKDGAGVAVWELDRRVDRSGRSSALVNIEAAASPMKRPGRPEDIAAACSYLASRAANYVTGQTLSVDGGRYLV